MGHDDGKEEVDLGHGFWEGGMMFNNKYIMSATIKNYAMKNEKNLLIKKVEKWWLLSLWMVVSFTRGLVKQL